MKATTKPATIEHAFELGVRFAELTQLANQADVELMRIRKKEIVLMEQLERYTKEREAIREAMYY